MAAEQRRLLQQLLATESLSTSDDLRSPRLCRPYCVGFCVNELFLNTKSSIGQCRKLHSFKLKELYQKGEPIPEFEREFKDALGHALKLRASRIESLKKSAEVPESVALELAETQLLFDNTKQEVHLTEAELKCLGLNGQITKARSQLQKLSALQDQLRTLASKLRSMSEVSRLSDHQNLKICQVCGSFLSIDESDYRLAHHFGGKLHRGFAQVVKEAERLSLTTAPAAAST